MYKKLIFLISIVLLLSLPAAAANNLLLNPSFEDNTGAASAADYWTNTGDPNIPGVEPWAAHTGDWGMAVVTWRDMSEPNTGEFYQDVVVSESTDYLYAIWACRDVGPLTGDYYMRVEWYDGENLLDSNSLNINDDANVADLTELTLNVTSPAGCDTARVMIKFVTIDQAGKFDDAYFGIPESARTPSPLDGAEDVDFDALLSWTAGDGATSHEVYLGTDETAVNDANKLDDEYEGSTSDPNYDPGLLNLNTTYYWRIDEVDGTTTKGDVWSFTVTSVTGLRNISFEDNTGGGGSAAHWTNTGCAGTEEWANHTGSWGMALVWWNNEGVGEFYQDVPVTEDTNYAYSIWALRDGGTPDADSYIMKLGWYDADLNPVGTPSSVFRDITGEVNSVAWTEISLNGTSPAGCAIARITMVGAVNLCGKFDDADLRQVGVAYGPDPADEAVRVSENQILSWTAGSGTASHDVYLGTSFEDVNDANTSDTTGIYRDNQSDPNYDPSGLEFETTYHWRIDEVDGTTTLRGEVWSFTVIPPIAREPSPGYGVITDSESVTLSWLPGAYVQDTSGHEVYFGTDWGEVFDANGASDPNVVYIVRDVNNYNPGTLSFDTTYYWRVDEVNAAEPNGLWKGDVWVFYVNENLLRNPGFEYNTGAGGTADWWAGTTESGVEEWDGAPHTGDWLMALVPWPERGDGTGDVYQDTIPVTENIPYLYKLWVCRDADTLTGQFNMAVDWLDADGNSISKDSEDISADMSVDWAEKILSVTAPPGSVEAKVIIDCNEINRVGKFDDAYFGMITQIAYEPIPGNEATGVDSDVDLSWAPGRDVQATNGHQVYFGTDETAVNDANSGYVVRDANNYNPGTLELGMTYYWRVDEVNTAEPNDSPWKGDIWSFTVVNHIVLEDFEIYVSDSNLRTVWVPAGGAGDQDVRLNTFLSPLVPAHESAQSMRLRDDQPDATEACRTYPSPYQDWSGDTTALDIWFYGEAGTSINEMYVKLEDATGRIAKVDYAGNANNLKVEDWQVWHISLQAFVDDNSVSLAQIEKITIGIDGGGVIFFDDLRLYVPRCLSEEIVTDFTGDCFVGYEDLDLMFENWLVGDYNVPTSAPNDANTYLEAYYALDDGGSSTIATDSSGNGRNGTLGTDPCEPTWVGSGRIGTDSLSFDGDDSVNCGVFDPSGDANELTVAAWVYWDGIGGNNQSIVAKRDVWNDQGDDMMWQLCISVVCDGSFKAEFVRGGDTSGLGSAGLMPKAEWVHLAASCDGTNGTFYINGREVKTGAFTLGTGTDAHVVIGATDVNSNEGFSGDIDDVRMYNYALSEAEVAYLVGGAGTLYVPLDLETEEFDIYEDGRINFKDYAVLAEDWLEAILWP